MVHFILRHTTCQANIHWRNSLLPMTDFFMTSSPKYFVFINYKQKGEDNPHESLHEQAGGAWLLYCFGGVISKIVLITVFFHFLTMVGYGPTYWYSDGVKISDIVQSVIQYILIFYIKLSAKYDVKHL